MRSSDFGPIVSPLMLGGAGRQKKATRLGMKRPRVSKRTSAPGALSQVRMKRRILPPKAGALSMGRTFR